jgi:hypothetical protein
VLVEAFGARRAFDTLVVAPGQVAGQCSFELLDRGLALIMVVGHLVLQAAEGPLASAVVRRSTLPAHRPGPLVLFHAPNPSRPPAVAAPIRVDNRSGILGQHGSELVERTIHELRVGMPAHCVGENPATATVHDRRDSSGA